MGSDTLQEQGTDLERLVEVKDDTYSPPGKIRGKYRMDMISSDDAHCNEFAHDFSSWLNKQYPARVFGSRADEIFIAANEQVINVKEHANHDDPEKFIYVQHYRVGQRVHVHVSSEAPQRDYPFNKWSAPHLPDPGAKPHKRGWGMCFTKEYTDQILIDSDGKGLILVFELFPRVISKKDLKWQSGTLEDKTAIEVIPTKEGYNDGIDRIDEYLCGRVPQRCADHVSVALTEALKNYCEHSQDWNPAGHVRIDMWKRSKGVYARIRSDGKGFDPRKVVDSPELRGYRNAPDWFMNGRKGDDANARFGWGSMIIKGEADLVMYSPDGKTLDLGFRLTE